LPRETTQAFTLRYLVREDYYKLRTYIVGTESVDDSTESRKPTLVMLAGEYSGSVQHFKTVAPLYEKFRVVLVDQFGFGGSQRPPVYPTNVDKEVRGW